MNKLWKALTNYLNENAKDPSRERYAENSEKAPAAPLTCGAMAVLVFVIYYKVAHAYCLMDGLQDMKAHAEFAQNFYLNPTEFFKTWLKVPHMLWHLVTKALESRMGLPLWDAASLSFALFGLFAFAVMTWFLYGMLKCHTGQRRLAYASLLGAFLSFVGPLIMEWFSNPYLGSFTPNPLHNPTHIASKGFGMLAMMAGIDVIRAYRGESPAFFRKHPYLWFSISALLSVLAKPTFLYMLLPAGVLLILIDLLGALKEVYLKGSAAKEASKKKATHLQLEQRKKLKAIWNTAWKLALASLPACAYILTEYVALFFWGTEQGTSVVFTKPFEVWHFYTWDVPTSVLLGMLFPIWMLLTNLGYFYKSAEGRLSVLGYAFGVLEFSILAESGSRKDAGNFSWCMMAGMTVFYAVAVYRLMLTSLQEKSGKAHTAYLIISWFLLLLHLYSGLSLFNVFAEIL